MKHIGLIGGIGPAATEFYYRNLVKRHVGAGTKMDLTIVHADVATLIGNFTDRAYTAQVEDYMKYVKRLQAAGCDAIATTSMAGHFCINGLIEASPLPVINAIPAINDYFSAHGIGCVGLLGTGGVMESKLYGGITSAEVMVPMGDAFERVSEDYFALARTGMCTDEQRAFFFDVGREMINRSADAVMLAGTDLCLAFNGHDPGFPVVDSALVHVDALFEKSLCNDCADRLIIGV